MNVRDLEMDNHGERLVPGYSHDATELARHKSTYQVFKKIIEQDIQKNHLLSKEKIIILDFGCGTGHGSLMLAQIPNTLVYGIDISTDAIAFAKTNYHKENIIYLQSDAEVFLKERNVFDYVVSRHALEHIANAAELILKFKYKNRLLVSVPYKEAAGNEFHLHVNIDESFFSELLPAKEFVYENLTGINDVKVFEGEVTNSFTCVSSQKGFCKITDMLSFPQEPYKFIGLEKASVFWQGEARRLEVQLKEEISQLQIQVHSLQDNYNILYNSKGVRAVRFLKRIICAMGLKRYK